MRSIILAVCFLAVFAGRPLAQSLDYNIIEELNIDNKSEALTNTYRFFSDGNTAFIIGAPVFLLADGYRRNDQYMIKAGENALVSLGVSTAVTWALKYSINRPRPFQRYSDVVKLSSGGGSSFPSGHTSSAFAVATSISMSYPKWYVIVPCYVWAGSVGVSRIALGVHYPSDVLAGAVVGAGSAWLTVKANHWLHHDKSRHSAAL